MLISEIGLKLEQDVDSFPGFGRIEIWASNGLETKVQVAVIELKTLAKNQEGGHESFIEAFIEPAILWVFHRCSLCNSRLYFHPCKVLFQYFPKFIRD